MRCDQVMGLNERADEIVEGGQILLYTEEVTRKYPCGKIETGITRPVSISDVKREPSGEHFCGMMDQEYPLFKYTFKDGHVLFERVQCEPWSSGPVVFLALQDESGKWIEESLWTDEEIRERS